jgi:type I restriction enzyme S subunit
MVNLSPKLRFPEFSGNWKSKKLEEVGTVINGLTYSPDDIHDDGVLVLRSSNIKENQLSFNDNVYVHTDNYNAVKENDILICVRNGSRNLIGKNALITKEVEGVAFGAFMSVYRSELNKFVFQLFATDTYYKIIQENLGATINSINNSDLKKFDFYFPLKEEQDKIANFLNSVDNKISKLTKKKALLEQYKKGIMQKIFNQEIRFKDDNNNDYADWTTSTLGQVAEIKRGAASQHLNYTNDKNNGIRLLRINDFLNNDAVYIENTKEIQKFKVQTNDLLIAGTGATAGIIFIIPEEFNNLPFSYNAPRIKIKNAYYKYIYHYLKSDIILRQQQKLFVGNAQPFLDTDAMRGFKIKLPSMAEQIKIGDFLSIIDERVNKVNTQLYKSKDFKKGLLQQMFI